MNMRSEVFVRLSQVGLSAMRRGLGASSVEAGGLGVQEIGLIGRRVPVVIPTNIKPAPSQCPGMKALLVLGNSENKA